MSNDFDAEAYVWRLVQADGSGPYNCAEGGLRGFTLTGDYYEHPAPWMDPLVGPAEVTHGRRLDAHLSALHLFGFVTADQARRWFYNADDCAALGAAGWMLRAYRRDAVRHVYVARTQCIFIPGKARFAELHPSRLHTMSAADLAAFADAILLP